jgi:enediyne biosynthesis protein E4
MRPKRRATAALPALLLVGTWGVGATAHAAPGAIPHFTDITVAAGIDVTGLGNASSWVDYDGDADLDLLATNSDFSSRVWLYRNDGDGTFTDVTGAAGLSGLSIRSVAWGDYDNDGWVDFAATTYQGNGRTQLFHNRGDGTFAHLQLASSSIPWRVTWGDYDRDGFLDLYQGTWGSRDLLYHNNGNGTFSEVARSAGVSNPESSNDAGWADFDGDGWPDLFVADDGRDYLYRNDGDVTQQAGVSDPQESQAACWGDYDADQDPDLYVVDISTTHNHLYRNNGDGTFTDVTQQLGVGDVGDGRTCNWLDVDNDGRLDLFTANHVHANRLYKQGPDGTFRDVAPAAGISNPFDTFNAAWGDFEGDGDLDVVAVGHFDNVLLRNDGPVGGFLQLDLIGSTSNRSAIGARVSLRVPGKHPTRWVEGSNGAYGHDSLTVEFGVGAANGPFTVDILWPDGAIQTVGGLQRNSRSTVVEG